MAGIGDIAVSSLSGLWNQRRFFRPDACALGSPSGAAVPSNVSWSAGDFSECVVGCSRTDLCAAALHRLGTCYAFNWTQLYALWLGGGAACPESFVAAELVNQQQLNFTTCQQFETAFNAPCERAIDGNPNQNFDDGSCTHTGFSSANWWQAQLPQPAVIVAIAIYNRATDSERLNNFTVKIDGAECVRYNEPSVFSMRNFTCGRVGQTVRIDLGKLTALTLCEVVAYGSYV